MILVIVFVGFVVRKPFIKMIDRLQGFYFVNQADREFKHLRLDKAIYYYNKALSLYPEHSKARCNLGNIYLLYEDYESASQEYEEALRYSPNFTTCRMDLGIVKSEKMSEYDDAIQNYIHITKQRIPWIYIPYFYTKRNSEKINRGIAYYNMGLAYRGKATEAGEYSMEAKEYNRLAVEAYKKAAEILKNDFDVYYNMALSYQLMNEEKQAGIAYCKAISIQPFNHEAHYNLAVLLRKLNMYAYALSEFEKAALTTPLDDDGSRRNYSINIMNDVNNKLSLMGDQKTKYAIQKNQKNIESVELLEYRNGHVYSSEAANKSIIRNFKSCDALEELKSK